MKRAVLAAFVASTLLACESTKPRSEPKPSPPAVAPPVPAPPAPVAIDAAAPDASPPDAEPPYVMTPMDRINTVPAAMVSRDGTHVLLRIVDVDGARGDANLAFHVRDRKDQTVKQQVVIALDEKLDDATRDKRIAAAEKLIAAQDLVPLPELFSENDGPFAGEGMTIETKRSHLVFTVSGNQVLDRPLPAAWKSKSYVDKLEGITCTNPELIRAAWAAPAKKIAVVEVAYEGTDTCWAPSPQLHVVAW